MMKHTETKFPRILAIAPSTRGFGYAVLEGKETLVNWGVKTVRGDKNRRCIEIAGKMLAHYHPEVMVLQDHSGTDSRRPVRIRVLAHGIIDLAPKHGVSVVLFTRKQIDKVFFARGRGTRYARAEILAKRFPEELGFELPPKRRAWMKEDPRMDIFDAVALALMMRVRRRR
jgi:hypothetical protein